MATIMQNRDSKATLLSSTNLLAGLLEELLKRPSALRVMGVVDAITTTQPTASFIVGDKVIIDDQGIMVAAVANRIDIPTDILATAGGQAGTRLTLRWNNRDSATRIFTWRVEVRPLA